MSSKLLENRPLFKECIEVLGVNLLSEQESDRLSALFQQIVPLTNWGKVDWDKIDQKIDIGYDPQNIIPTLERLIKEPIDTSVYIEWSTASVPVIKADLRNIIEHFDDVTCVAFEKFIFNLTSGYVIEVLPSYKMMAGLIKVNAIT